MRVLPLLLLAPLAARAHEAPLDHAHPHGFWAFGWEGAALAAAVAAGLALVWRRQRR